MNKSDLINFYLENAIKDCELTTECLGRTIDKSYKILIYILVSINFCIGIIINNSINHIIVETMLLFSSINFIIGIVLLFLNLKGFTIKSSYPSIDIDLVKTLQKENISISEQAIDILQARQIENLYNDQNLSTKTVSKATKTTNYALISCFISFLISFLYFLIKLLLAS
jgi:hypothetical protein